MQYLKGDRVRVVVDRVITSGDNAVKGDVGTVVLAEGEQIAAVIDGKLGNGAYSDGRIWFLSSEIQPLPVAPTVKQLVDQAVDRVRAVQGDHRDPGAREFALAITHLEDAQMRFTRGLAIRQGKFNPVDLEKSEVSA